MDARKAYVHLLYKGKKLDNWIDDYLTSFQYVDPAQGESDTISMTLRDNERKWIGKWMPIKGDYIDAAINEKKCGVFLIDEMNFSGRPTIANIKGVSIPMNSCFKATKRSKTWERVSIQEIGSQIASRYEMKFVYDASVIVIESLEQSEKADSEFLSELCKKYGLSMKVYSNKLIIYDDAVYEQKIAVADIHESYMLSWSYATTINKTYTGGKIQYTSPTTEETIDLVVGDSARLYECTEKADSLEDAKRIVVAAVNEANKSAETISFSVLGTSYNLYASQVINIHDLEDADGRYFITKVTHSVSSSGYVLNVEARKIQKRLSVV